jgi:AraC-like DNA-binding protein
MVEPISEVVSRTPAAPLRHLVDDYLGYRLEGHSPGVHRGLPSAYLTFIISLGEAVDITGMPDPGQPPDALDAFVGGLHAGPALIRHDGNQVGVSVQLTPLGTRSLLGMPASAVASTVVGLDDLLGRSRSAALQDRLREVATWPERFDVLDEVLLSALRQPAPPPAEVVEAWRRVVATDGAIDVRSLAADVGWSRRHLSERFRAEFGLTPKLAARVVRFQSARRLLSSPRRRSIADVAAMAGYYDQAHLTRDWNELAGCTPSVWLAEELPSVQDDDTLVVAQ